MTATERQLTALVAQGLSNKEIAAALFVTPKTVGTKLSRIYAKVGVHSRTELSRRLKAAGVTMTTQTYVRSIGDHTGFGRRPSSMLPVEGIGPT